MSNVVLPENISLLSISDEQPDLRQYDAVNSPSLLANDKVCRQNQS